MLQVNIVEVNLLILLMVFFLKILYYIKLELKV